MNCRVIFTDTAEADLRDIAFYIAKQSKDKNIAIRFVNKLREKCKKSRNTAGKRLATQGKDSCE